MRHLHPQEVALFTGLTPEWVIPSNLNGLRLDLAGVGQCATPAQSAWVMSQLIQGAVAAQILPQHPTPHDVLWAAFQDLWDARDRVWECGVTKPMLIFQEAIQELLGKAVPTTVPSSPENLTEELREFFRGSSSLDNEDIPRTPEKASTIASPPISYSSCGGVHVFANAESTSPTITASPTATWPQYPAETTANEVPIPGSDELTEETQHSRLNAEQSRPDVGLANTIVVHLCHFQNSYRSEVVTIGTTVGQLIEAEQLLDQAHGYHANDVTGNHLDDDAILKEHQYVLIEGPDSGFTTMTNLLDQLWRQKGWTSDVDMAYYLSTLACTQVARTTRPIIIPHVSQMCYLTDSWFAG